jgi:UDP-N-acetylmuramate dehydrogenase
VPTTPGPRALLADFGADRLVKRRPLAPLTTFGIGGPADWFLDALTTEDVIAAVRAAAEDALTLVLLGGGSNVLVGDEGVRALVMRVRTSRIVREPDGLLRADAGVTLNGLVRRTILEGLGGLEAWAGTPGTVGGALVGNAHWAGRLIGDYVASVTVLTRGGEVVTVPASEMGFGYDRSRVQQTGEIVLAATFRLTPGQAPDALRATARASLLHRKQTQPLRLPSAGCIFQNPVVGIDQVPDGTAWSAGALVDRAGLKGRAIGGARVSPVHANFIVNEGGATARDVRALVELCRAEVRRQFGVRLRDEIVYVGAF